MAAAPTELTSEPVFAPYRMHARYGLLLRWIMRWLFEHVDLPAKHAERLAVLRERGPVVYVTRGRACYLVLCFNYLLQRLGLPLPRAVGGTRFLWLQPIGHLWRAFQRRRQPIVGPFAKASLAVPLTRREAIMAQQVWAGHDAFVVLSVPRSHRGIVPDLNDYVHALIVAQRFCARPILLAPHALVTREQSGATDKTWMDRFFGERRRPSSIRYWAMLLSLRHGAVRMADPLDLQAFMAAHPDADARVLTRKVRHELQRRIREEERVVAGPQLTAYEHLARQVLRTPQVRAAMDEAARRTHRNDLVLELQAQDALRHIAARYDVRIIKLMEWVLHGIFNRIYDGIAVDERGLARAIEASRRGPVVFCPSHRSHIDYLVLSFVLWTHGIAPPHIAAGANLSFFPLGRLFRGCGAFFLRRTFRHDPLYAAVFNAYLAHLLAAGTSIEFFLEGTRSRTGKMLMPRFGILKMLVDAWRQGGRDDVMFVPISIDYERIIEAQSYERELRGVDKRPEDLAGLLATTRVLRSRYGRVQLQFGAPISLKALAQSLELPQNAAPAHDVAWRRAVQALGFRILHEAANVASVTPSSVVCTALLGHSGRGMAQGTLIERADNIVHYLSAAGARLSQSVAHEEMRVSAVLEAVQKIVDEGHVTVERAGRHDMEPIYRVADDSRVALDYHKNSVMNYFAPAALIARAMRRRGMSPTYSLATLLGDTKFLSRLFKKEFLFRADAPIDALFAQQLAALAVRGLVDVTCDDSVVVVLAPEQLLHLANLLDSFVQAYWIVARTLLDLRAQPLMHRALCTHSLERARRAFLEGHITRPETANHRLIQGALAWMQDQTILVEQAGLKPKSMALDPAYGADKLQQLIDQIGAYL